MTSQKNNFLTVEDAVRLTRTSESTIRRFIRSLDSEQRRKYTTKDGRRIMLDQAFVCSAFDIVQDGHSDDLVELQRKTIQDVTRVTDHLTQQNDKLLSELQKATDDLKTAWSLIDQLKGEVFRLTSEVKRLEAPKTNSILFVVAVVLCLVVIAALLFELL